jgi:AcrR family transcriptional regulator
MLAWGIVNATGRHLRPYAREMPPTRTSYHHGALRDELLSASLRLIEAEGIGAVSLRRVAREAGVSPGAPYHHFADRAALLAALSEQGFRLLTAEFTVARAAAADGGRGPAQVLGALLRAYVGFAQRHGAYFRLMFRPELFEPDRHPGVKAAEHAAEDCLEEAVGDCVRAGLVPPGDADTAGIAAWSLAHGLASLWLDGQFRHYTDDPVTVAARVTAMIESFLGARDAGR